MTLDIASTAFLAQSALSGAPALNEVSVEEARLMYTGMAALSHEGPEMASVEEIAIPAVDGASLRAHVLNQTVHRSRSSCTTTAVAGLSAVSTTT